MPSKISQNNKDKPAIKVNIAPLLIVNNARYKPYSEVFNFSPANFTQQPLGSLFGFFKIRNFNEDAAYIVNFLASVIKKEYYVNPKRSVEESFDSALHKVNIALSELAKNGNISWLGAIDAAVCSVSQGYMHFSAAGHAHIYLIRNGLMNEISEGLSEKENVNPLKTFVNVSSGQLFPADKIIIASDEIFNVLSLEEIKKNSLRFKPDKFIQFLHTVFVNEMDLAEALVVDVFEKEKTSAPPKRSKDKNQSETKSSYANLFSAQTFTKKQEKTPPTAAQETEAESKKSQDFVDERTGHIYVQGEEKHLSGEVWRQKIALFAGQIASDFFVFVKVKTRRIFARIKEGGALLFKELRKKISSFTVQTPTETNAENLGEAKVETQKKEAITHWWASAVNKMRRAASKFSFLLPSFSKIRNSFSLLQKDQKMIGIILVFVIFVLPLIILKAKKPKAPPQKPAETPVAISPEQILSQEKNIKFNPTVSSLENENLVEKIELLKNYLVLFGKDNIFLFNTTNQEFFSVANQTPEMLSAVKATSMTDLNLFFFVSKDRKVYALSPTNKQVTAQKIELGDNTQVSSLATYTTYLYVLDSQANAIYRFPRAEGGFGSKTQWLKEPIDLSGAKDMAIDESIYVLKENDIIKLFKGKREIFNWERLAVEPIFESIYTNLETNFIYVLDSKNGRLIVFSKDGTITRQYHHQALVGCKDMTVDEKEGKSYLVSSQNDVLRLDL